MNQERDREGERIVLMMIGGGIIAILLCLIGAIAFARGMPDWGESVMSAIAGGSLVKLADVLSALVQLSTGRERQQLADQVAQSTPFLPPAAVTP